MKKRFSTKAFILATLIHLAVMSVLFDTSFRLLAEWRRTGVEVNPVWLKAMWWIWEPLPMLIQRMYPLPNSFYAQIIVIWSLCVGAIFGFSRAALPRMANTGLSNRFRDSVRHRFSGLDRSRPHCWWR
jgi:hypothetical protein